MGGLTAYHVAAENERFRAVIVTTLPDLRKREVQRACAANRLMSDVVHPIAVQLPVLFDRVHLHAGSVGRMEAMAPDPEIGRVRMPSAFYRTLSERQPAKEPENFECPPLYSLIQRVTRRLRLNSVSSSSSE
ncbi:MAG: hypothetical protein AAFZ38_12570 [Myxococcota bacterium]